MKALFLVLTVTLAMSGCKNGDKKEEPNPKPNPENPWVKPSPSPVAPTPVVPPIVTPTPAKPPVVQPTPAPSFPCSTKAEAGIDCYVPHRDVSNCQYFKTMDDIKKAAELAKGPDCVLVDGEMVYNGFGPCLQCKKMMESMSLKSKTKKAIKK